MSIDRSWILVARKLSGESSIEEIRELEELLRTHPDLHFSIEIITNLWNQQASKDQDSLESSYSLHVERMKNLGIPMQPEAAREDADSTYLLHGSRQNRIRRKLAIAAAVLVILAAGGFFYLSGSKPMPSEQEAKLEVRTKYRSRTDIQLPDGTKVRLNSGSTLTYDKQFGKEIREVVLSGEAFFEVVRNEEKPFIIHTTSMDIKVLGTRFNVKSYAGDKVSEASLINGSIEISLKKRASEKILLKPNEKIVVMNDEVLNEKPTESIVKNRPSEQIFAVQTLHYNSKDSAIIETSWVDNKIIFENESFEDLAIKMQRWFGTDIQFEDANLKHERFSGSFTNETIEEALNALRFSTAFNYFKRNNTIIITK